MKAMRLAITRTKREHSYLPFENERNGPVRRVQAEEVLAHLVRCGHRIVKTGEDRGVRPSNIGE